MTSVVRISCKHVSFKCRKVEDRKDRDEYSQDVISPYFIIKLLWHTFYNETLIRRLLKVIQVILTINNTFTHILLTYSTIM